MCIGAMRNTTVNLPEVAAMVLRLRAKGHPVIGRNLTVELARATMLPINLKWTSTEIYRTLHLIFNKSV